MQNIILFDTAEIHQEFLPITFTRPVSDIRIGIFTIREKWEHQFPGIYSYDTVDYLAGKYPINLSPNSYYIAGNVCPDEKLATAISSLSECESLFYKDELVAFYGSLDAFRKKDFGVIHTLDEEPFAIRKLYDIFLKNGEALETDYKYIVSRRKSEPFSDSNRIIGDPYFPDGTSKVFLEPGAVVECSVLNVTKGPVYIGKNTEIMEGTCIRAPFAACEHVL